jgi:uncharacterized protein (TIGR03435 family)
MAMLVGYAIRFPPDRVMGPNWMMTLSSPRFDIAAKLPPGAAENQVPEMLQALLADRFKLALHRGTTTQPIYALVVAKGGLKLKTGARGASDPVTATEQDEPPALGFYGSVQDHTIANADGHGSTTTISSPRMGTVRETDGPNRLQRWESESITLGGLADLLDKVVPLSSPIMNATGLNGRYRLVLEVSLEPRTGGNPTPKENGRADMEETILRAYNDGLRKLGLQLDRRKGPFEILIVDRVEKSPTEN